jgi:hypothetical protein
MIAFKAIQYYLAFADAFVESGQAYYDIKHTLLVIESACPCSMAYITFPRVICVHDSQTM